MENSISPVVLDLGAPRLVRRIDQQLDVKRRVKGNTRRYRLQYVFFRVFASLDVALGNPSQLGQQSIGQRVVGNTKSPARYRR